MTLSNENEEKIRAYLVGDLDESVEQEFEERLLTDRELAQHVLVVEDELIEDYERGALEPGERERFETDFLNTPRRRRKLLLVRAARKYAERVVPVTPAHGDLPGWRRLLRSLSFPRWKLVAAACLVIAAVGAGLWRTVVRESPVAAGMAALNEAYASRRPVEARVSGLRHAPFVVTRGAGPEAVDYRARDLSAALLLEAVRENPTPEALRALGRFYLMREEFNHAIQQFEGARKLAPEDAGLHADLGAALFEKGKLERRDEQSGRSELTLAQSLEHLTTALKLDDTLPEPRFNRALLYEELKLPERAREDWEKYLAQDSDPHSPWAAEARTRLEQLRARREKASRREEELFRRFMQAYADGDEERARQELGCL